LVKYSELAEWYMALKIGNFGRYNRNTWKVLKFGAGEVWRRSLGPILWEVSEL
jgi:hypothetical protein